MKAPFNFSQKPYILIQDNKLGKKSCVYFHPVGDLRINICKDKVLYLNGFEKIQSFASFKYKEPFLRQKIQKQIALKFKAIDPKLGIA